MYYFLGEMLFPVLNMKADPAQNLEYVVIAKHIPVLLLIHPEPSSRAAPCPLETAQAREQEVWSLVLLLAGHAASGKLSILSLGFHFAGES